MYSTVKEMHLAIDMGLQHINSNRKQSIPPEWKDMALNYAVLQFIENRTSAKSNRKQEGLEDTQKRYDDLKDLKSANKVPTYKSDNYNRVFSILPSDYYKLISLGGKVKYSKFNLLKESVTDHIYCRFLPFPDNNIDGESYRNFSIAYVSNHQKLNTLFNINNYPNVPKLFSRDSKFVLVNLVLETINSNPDYNIYWEQWNNIYKKDTFIIITNQNHNHYLRYSNINTAGYNAVNISNRIWIRADYNLYSYKRYKETIGSYKDVDLVSSEHEFEVKDNYYYNKNKHLNPSAYMDSGTIYLQEGDTFNITETHLVYYKKPRLINYRTNSICEIQVNREIVDLAVQRLKAYIKDEGYQHIVNENQIIE